MKSLCVITLLAGACAAAPYIEETRRVFPETGPVHCLAGEYAGTARGLLKNRQPVDGFTGHSVDVCATDGANVYFTFNGGLYQAGVSQRIAALPAGAPRTLAVRNGIFLYGTATALFGLVRPAAAFSSIPLPAAVKDVRSVALSPSSDIALATDAGLYYSTEHRWNALYPRDGARSWAPADVRAVAFDAAGALWFASPQGAGRRDANGWKLFTGHEGLPYDDFTTIAIGEPGVVWFGTRIGAIRYDGATWAYRQGLRWLPDDDVRAISVNPNGDALFATAKGLGVIERRPATLAAKAEFFESEIDRRHRRTPYGYVLNSSLPVAGDTSKWENHDSDNDGLWTGMYGAGECFAYAATRSPAAKQRATKAFEALRFLSQVTQGGEHPAPKGFPARSILPTSGPDPNANDSLERDKRTQAHHDHLWKVMSPRWPRSADGKWYWKTDTSSDELDGHYFLYALYNDLVAETAQEKAAVQQVVRDVTDHMLDHNYSLVDWDGKPTRWAVFDPASLNDGRLFLTERGLNSLSMLAYLKVAEHVTGDARYTRAYQTLVRDHKYATNAMIAKVTAGPGTGNQSDDEMAFMCYYLLLKYETDSELVQRYARSLASYWSVERPEMNPLFNFIAAAGLKDRTFSSAFRTEELTARGPWLEDSLDTLRRIPRDRVDWRHRNSHRKDIVPLRSFLADDDEIHNVGFRPSGRVLPADERFFSHWNHNPYSLNTGGQGHNLADGAVFLLPYYMGLYHHFIEE